MHLLSVIEEFELEGYTADDFYDWVLEPFLPLLHRIPPLDQHVKPTLHDFFLPETMVYILGVASGELSTTPKKVKSVDGTTLFFLKPVQVGD